MEVSEEDLESMFNNPVVPWSTMRKNSDGGWTVSFKNKHFLKEAMEYVKLDREGSDGEGGDEEGSDREGSDGDRDGGWFKYYKFEEL